MGTCVEEALRSGSLETELHCQVLWGQGLVYHVLVESPGPSLQSCYSIAQIIIKFFNRVITTAPKKS